MASDFDCITNTHHKWRGTTMSVATTGRSHRTQQRSVSFFFSSFFFFFSFSFWDCGNAHPSLRLRCEMVLWWRVTLWLHNARAIRRLCVINRWSQGDGHDAECLWLKKLHCSPHVFFHKFCNLSLRTVVRPLLPCRLIPTTFTSFFLWYKVPFGYHFVFLSSSSTENQKIKM